MLLLEMKTMENSYKLWLTKQKNNKFKQCPFKEGCYNNTKEKPYSISIKSEEHIHQMAYLEPDDYLQKKAFIPKLNIKMLN